MHVRTLFYSIIVVKLYIQPVTDCAYIFAIAMYSLILLLGHVQRIWPARERDEREKKND